MSDTLPRTIGWGDYRCYCRVLGRHPDDGLLPAARGAAIPSWLTQPLIATEFAREKLLRWATRAEPSVYEPADVLVRLAMFGDEILLHRAAQLICRLPAPVVDYVIARVTFVGVGTAMAGFCGPGLDFANRPWLIVLSAVDGGLERFHDLVAHEIAHAWLMREPAADVRLGGAFWHSVVYRLSIPDVIPPDALAAIARERAAAARDERHAQALTRDWGFRDF